MTVSQKRATVSVAFLAVLAIIVTWLIRKD